MSTDPETHVSIGQRHRAKLRVNALEPTSHDPAAVERLKAEAKIAADPKRDFPLERWGPARTIPHSSSISACRR